MTPQNQTQNNLNHFYQNNLNTVSNSNKSNNNTNNQFNYIKNNNVNFISNFQTNFNNPNNTHLNSIHDLYKDKNKREIIEEILRDTSSGSFFARIDRERPFTPPFTKLVAISSLDKINTIGVENKDFNNNLINVNVNSCNILNNELVSSKAENMNSSQFLNQNKALNDSVQLNMNNINNNPPVSNNLNSSKVEDNSDINYMDLIYDQVMGHYYDPKTNVYYELKNIGNAKKVEI